MILLLAIGWPGMVTVEAQSDTDPVKELGATSGRGSLEAVEKGGRVEPVWLMQHGQSDAVGPDETSRFIRFPPLKSKSMYARS